MPSKLKAKSLKSDKRYKDAPRYPVIIQYESELKKNFDNNLNEMNIELVKKMKDLA